jgi:hypothetical protein
MCAALLKSHKTAQKRRSSLKSAAHQYKKGLNKSKNLNKFLYVYSDGGLEALSR